MFFYSSEKSQFEGSIPLSRINKNTQFKKHLENLMFLEFISLNTKDFKEKHQAEKEIIIAKKKMIYWSRFKDFDQKQKELDTVELKKKWAGK